MKLFSNLWHGRVRLWKIFWLGWVGIGLALPITFTLLASAHLKPSVDAALGKSFGQPASHESVDLVFPQHVDLELAGLKVDSETGEVLFLRPQL